MIEVIRVKDYEAMSLYAARLVAAQVRLVPDSILGLATGSTPLGMYRELVRQHREEGLDFSQVTTSIWTSIAVCRVHMNKATATIWTAIFLARSISIRN